MSTLGEDLKAARESKGLTLKEISERTRISLSFLTAIEEDDYSVIPGEVFVTGFLRSYAKELGLPEKEILARYREARQQPQEGQPAMPQPEKPAKQQHWPRPSIVSFGRGVKEKGYPLWWIIVAGLIIIAIPAGVSLYLTRGNTPKTEAPPAPAVRPMAPATTASRPASSFGQSTGLKNRTTAALKQKAPEKPAPAPASVPPLTVTLTATESTWYAARADNGRKESATLSKGETAAITANDRIVLDIGNAGGLRVALNGKALKPYGKHGEAVKGVVFLNESQGRAANGGQQKKSMPTRTSQRKKR